MNQATDAAIEAVFMTAQQKYAFEIFYGLGEDRTLPKLETALHSFGEEVSLATLKRWSAKFKWADLVTRTEHHVADKLSDAVLPEHVERTKKDLEAISKLKDKFYKAVEAGTIDVGLPEFIQLIKTEAFLRGDPTERKEEVHTHKISLGLSEDELAEAVRFAAAKKHGLPSPAVIKNVTGSGSE